MPWPALAALLVLIAGPAGAAVVRIDGAQARRIGLTVAPARIAASAPLATLPGVVVPPPNGRVAVAAPFAGVVRQSFVIEGQVVTRGQRLAVVQSRDVLETGAELARARARLDVARRAATRSATLVREGVIAGARAEEAAAALREAEVEVDEKARILRLANANASSGTYVLTAPIAGRVTQAAVQTGSALDGLEAPFVIDAPGPYHVQAQLPARLTAVVRAGMRVRVDNGAQGRVLAVGSTIDPATRSALLRASIATGPQIPAGRTVSLVVMADPPAGAVVVPSAAVVQIARQPTVFEQTPQGFASRPVRVLGATGGQATVTGLRVGAQVAVSGTSELKSMSAGR